MGRHLTSYYPSAHIGIHRRCTLCGNALWVTPEGQMRCSLCGRAGTWRVRVDALAADLLFAVDWGPAGPGHLVNRKRRKA
jgi:hypothetical protein